MPLLSASDISFSYGSRRALNHITLALQTGEFVGLIGPNGSGKSTLIKSLMGFLPAEGSITWNERDLKSWRRRDLAKFLAYLPQSPHHEPGQTVLDILRLGRFPYWGPFGLESSADEGVVVQVAQLLELDQLMDRPLEQLSGGQRQRVFVGRCLSQQPRAMLLDEPNTFLDLKSQVELCQLLKNLAKTQNLSLLMASHELNIFSAYVDRLILLDQGKIAAAGSPKEILRPEILEPVYGIAIERFDGSQANPVVTPKIQIAK